jgi:hypothetical protein
VWIRFIWLRIGTSSGLLERGNQPLGSVKGKEFPDYPGGY